MFYVVSIGDKLASSGDIKMAKEHFEAVRLYDEAFSQSERFEVSWLNPQGTALGLGVFFL